MARPGHRFSETDGQSRPTSGRPGPTSLGRDTHRSHAPGGQSPGAPDDSCRAAGSGAGGHWPPDPDARTAPATRRTRRNGTPPCWSATPVPPRRIADRAGYRSRLPVVLVVAAVAHRRLGPSSSATTSTVDRVLPFILVNDLRRRMVLRARGGAPAVVLRRPRVRLRVIGRVVAAARARPCALGGSNALSSQCRAEGGPNLLSGRLGALARGAH